MARKEPLYPHVPKSKQTIPVGLETQKDILRHQLISLVDRRVIADAIIEDMEEEHLPFTFENAKTIWLDVLENRLHPEIKDAIIYKFNP